jgi:predicted NAD-dependent protein-ADP-ribosyltransferase YbiA (DUF1768 family)
MVKSLIDDSITYTETATIDEGDFGYDAIQFDIELFPNMMAGVALGNVRYTYADKGVLYIPVYLTKDDTVLQQIGVYEFLASQYTQLLDEDDDFDVTLLSNPLPLYFSFFTKQYLQKLLGTKTLEEDDEEEEIGDEDVGDMEPEPEKKTTSDPAVTGFEEEEIETDQWSSPNDETVLSEILKETDDTEKDDVEMHRKAMEASVEERSSYKEKKRDQWIKKFMKSSKYKLLDNEGGGDCLFATIRDAYKGTKNITVAQLREVLSKHATQKVFNDFKEQYDMYNTEKQATYQRMLTLKNDITALKVQFQTAPSRDEKKKIMAEANAKIEDFRKAKREHKYAIENMSDYTWMHGVDTLAKFKEKIKTCRFWGETWTINVLEKALNIKLVILSKPSFDAADFGNVLLCGNMVDSETEAARIFKPKYYIVVAYTGNHYMLVLYKNKRIFTFNTLPYAIKELIVNKCMEGSDGIYNFIPRFKALKDSISGEQPESPVVERKEGKVANTPSPVTDSGAEDIGMPEEEIFDEGFENMRDVSFNEDIVFQFYSKSRDMKPGKGAGEKIKKEDVMKFAELAGIKNWRKVLSNFYEGEFTLDGKRWLSVEHFYHASKFKKGNPEFYALFSLDSDSELSKSPLMAKGAGGKTGKVNKKQFRPKKIKIDADFFTSKENERAMYRAQMAKYKQVDEARRVLMATKDAKLQHFIRAKPPIIFYDTMKIREVLS